MNMQVEPTPRPRSLKNAHQQWKVEWSKLHLSSPMRISTIWISSSYQTSTLNNRSGVICNCFYLFLQSKRKCLGDPYLPTWLNGARSGSWLMHRSQSGPVKTIARDSIPVKLFTDTALSVSLIFRYIFWEHVVTGNSSQIKVILYSALVLGRTKMCVRGQRGQGFEPGRCGGGG